MNPFVHQRLIKSDGSINSEELDKFYKFMIMTCGTATTVNDHCNQFTDLISEQNKYKLMCVALFLDRVK